MMCTEEELLAAERTYWADELQSSEAKGKAEGIAEGMEKGMEKGIVEGMTKAILSMESNGETPERISFLLGMPLEEVKDIIRANG